MLGSDQGSKVGFLSGGQDQALGIKVGYQIGSRVLNVDSSRIHVGIRP